MHGDIFEARVWLHAGMGPDVRQHHERFIVELELALLDEFENGDRGQRFRETGDAKERIRLHMIASFEIRPAVASGKDELAILGNGEGGTRYTVPAHDRDYPIIKGLEPLGFLAG